LLAVLGAGASAQTLPLVAPPGTLACPQIHIFAARETLAAPGFGSAEALVNLVAAAFPNSTSEAINYPAAGDADYANSVADGIVAVLGQMQVFSNLCPETILIAHGYSQVGVSRKWLWKGAATGSRWNSRLTTVQGGQVFDDAFCGGPDGDSLDASARLVPDNIAAKVAAVIMMGNPRHVAGLPYNVGNATEPGVRVPAFSALTEGAPGMLARHD